MDNSTSAAAQARVHLFATASSWMEDDAIRQLEQLASRPGVLQVAAMPDLHPGIHGPVGCAVLTDAIVYPDIIGTDIGCGMQLWRLDIARRKLNLDKLEARFAALDGPWVGDAGARLEAAGLHQPEVSAHANALGSIGGGNHFCEVLAVEEIVDTHAAAVTGLAAGDVTLLVHSGSRSLGAAIRTRFAGSQGLPFAANGEDYLMAHDEALRFASLNRNIISARAMAAAHCEGKRLVDSPHNFVERCGNHLLHRKGAAAATRGLVPIAGSRGNFTYLVEPLNTNADALLSLAHGAGRKHDRGSMERRIRTHAGSVKALERTSLGSRVICTDRRLLIEEAPEAYKDVERVVGDLQAFGLARVFAILRPLITFKTARDQREGKRRVHGRAGGRT